MQRVLETIRDSIWLRVGVLAFVLLVVTWFMLPSELQRALWFKAVFYVGPPILISVSVFGATLWVTYKLKPAVWAGAFAFAAVLALVIISQEPGNLAGRPAGSVSEASRTAPQSPEPCEVPPGKDPFSCYTAPNAASRTRAPVDPFAVPNR
jgi:hypothetical protein